MNNVATYLGVIFILDLERKKKYSIIFLQLYHIILKVIIGL